ncbi:MAG: hypothetical protein JOZ78_25675 [Chroococcidiopsidaceae cyanobacterium CP_BM_ER_R8_30]|nr:hypothetical protein [Chroococcidiopsidaceae cyanobacterium CP_BM_ER_R8_30]
MKSQESKTAQARTTAPISSDTTSHINPQSKSEPMTQVQADSVLTRQQLPNLGFRLGVITTVFILISLFVIALYYGIINP